MKRKDKIYFQNEQKNFPVKRSLTRLIRRAVLASLAYEGFENAIEVSVTFVDNEGIRELNSLHRGIDRATDVLSFPLIDFEGGDTPPLDEPWVMLGDVVLSLERAAEQAQEFGHSFEREVAFLTVHSMLHLLGYDHELGEEEDRDMRLRQREILTQMGLSVS